MWTHVISHFERFLAELELKSEDRQDAAGKAERIGRSLFAKYYPGAFAFDPSCYVKVGSFGKGTATPHSDLDMLFVLPWDVYGRIDALAGNKQSQLLQEVKRALQVTFPRTELRGDGQVVIAPFTTYAVDIVPAFRFVGGELDGQFYIAHSGGGGSWRLSNPVAEYRWLNTVDAASFGQATHLVKMSKAWKRECNIDLKSICLETAATIFVNQWVYRDKGIGYYGWMVRDFFQFLLKYVNGSAKPVGITEWIPLGDAWQSKCQMAYNRAVKACEYEQADSGVTAVLEWQKIFGAQFKVNYAEGPLTLQSLMLAGT